MPRSLQHLLLAATSLIVSAGCAGQAEEPNATATNEISVDRVALPTAHTTLLAGDPYIPVLDERPLAIGEEKCLADPVIRLTPGSTNLDATFVATRKELLQKLDIAVEGVSIPKLAGTGAAKIASETRFGTGSIHVLFQARGTFESELVSLSREPEPFRPERIRRCGWGYVKKAHHRLAAVVIVSIEAANETSAIALGCPDQAKGCTTGVSAGPVNAKAALEDVLKRGSFNVSLRAAADVIPDLPPPPLGTLATLSSTPESYGEVLRQLAQALDWLGKAQVAIAEMIETRSKAPGSAPTTSVEFAYYPGLMAESRQKLEVALDELQATRATASKHAARIAAWEAFSEDAAVGRGHLYNVPGTPAQTVEELLERRDRILDTNGMLLARRRVLDRALSSCESALRNEPDGDVFKSQTALMRRVGSACTAPPPADWESTYDAQYGIRRLAPTHVSADRYDEWRDAMCPPGQRLPKRSEAAFLAPWSWVAPRSVGGGGIWIMRDHFLQNPDWIIEGRVERIGMFQAPRGLTVCFRDGQDLFE